jgi:ABC-type Fe3+ transport system substrate-binding protein
VGSVTPSEGTGAEIGSMSIVKGARNLEAAKKFYEWALTPAGAAVWRGRQAVPAAQQHAECQGRSANARSFKIKLINYDYAKYGASGRAAPPDREVGKGRQFAAALERHAIGNNSVIPDSNAGMT